jgi:hypothetical protein
VQPPAGEPAADVAPESRPATPANAAAPSVPADEPDPEPVAQHSAHAAVPEPEPAPAAEPAAPAVQVPAAETPAAEPVQELTVERVKRAWELILQRVQAVRVPLYGFLRDGRPTALEGDVLVVSLASEFAARNAAQGDNALVLADAVEGVLGRRLTARFDVAAGAQAPAPQTSTGAGSPPPAPLPDFTDQIRAAAAKLDAEVLPDEP